MKKGVTPMGAVKEYAAEMVCKAARNSGQDEAELMEEWNRNLRHPEKMVSLQEFLIRQKYKKK